MPEEMYLFYNLFSKEILEGYEVGKGTKYQMKVETAEGEVTLPRDRWVKLQSHPKIRETIEILNKNLIFLQQNALALHQEAKNLKDAVLNQLRTLPPLKDFNWPDVEKVKEELDPAPELPDSAVMPEKN